MAIYDIFEIEKKIDERAIPPEASSQPADRVVPAVKKGHVLSALMARFFFFLLFLADLVWALYSFTLFLLVGCLALLSLRKVPFLLSLCSRRWLSVKRSLICAVALGCTLFSPSFGIMIACTYFLMYDNSGIEEVVPSSLQEQFKEFFKAQ